MPQFVYTLIFASIAIASFAGWCTHIIKTIESEQWLFFIAGLVIAPMGAINGWGHWFGWW